jgi:hypothetical protein
MNEMSIEEITRLLEDVQEPLLLGRVHQPVVEDPQHLGIRV